MTQEEKELCEWFDSDGNPHVMPAFKAGAEWQKQRDKESSCEAETNCTPENDDLEEAASEYVREDFHERSRADFKAGAKWHENKMKEALQTEYEKGRFDMREEMMKDAADSKITTDGNSIFPIIKYRLPLTYDCKIGDKVKLIIIKED